MRAEMRAFKTRRFPCAPQHRTPSALVMMLMGIHWIARTARKSFEKKKNDTTASKILLEFVLDRQRMTKRLVCKLRLAIAFRYSTQ
jgi:hypothetical protein